MTDNYTDNYLTHDDRDMVPATEEYLVPRQGGYALLVAAAKKLEAGLQRGHKITAYEVSGSRVCYGCGEDMANLDLNDARCEGGTK